MQVLRGGLFFAACINRPVMKKTALRKLARWGSSLKLEQVPAPVREHAVNQVLSTLAAVYSGCDSDLGRPIERAFPSPASGPARILPTGTPAPASHAAFLMASWSMVLDFDDVMLGGHTGHSSVLVPWAMATAGGRTGGDLILAQIVANEIAARINMVCAMGSVRGQMATHLHLIGASAARAKLENLNEDKFEDAMSFALSYPAQALFPAFLGSDAKVLCAALPIRTGMEAVDAVQAGLSSAVDVLDDQRGFFKTLSRIPVRDFLDGLGERWHTETNSFKIYPVCGYLCSALDATLDLVLEHDISPDDVVSVDVWTSLFTVAMDAHSSAYLEGAQSRISTLTFSTPFVIASAILAREFTPAQLKRPWIDDERVWQLASRIKSKHDVSLTLDSMRGDIPIGSALHRTRRWHGAAFGWRLAATAFGRFGRWLQPNTIRLVVGMTAAAGQNKNLNLTTSTKPIGARVEVLLSDGRRLSRLASVPRGFAGSGENTRALMRTKFIASAASVIGHQRAVEVERLIEDLQMLSSVELACLFDLLCSPDLEEEKKGDLARHKNPSRLDAGLTEASYRQGPTALDDGRIR